MSPRNALAGILVCLLLAACAVSPRSEAPSSLPALVPADWEGLPEDGVATWRLDDAASRVHVLVYPDGRLKRFGHHHVVRPVAMQGRLVQRDDGSAAGRIRFDLYAVRVDAPEDRALEEGGFAKPLGADAAKGARGNMLGPVLDAEKHPVAVLDASLPSLAAGTVDAEVRVRLAGGAHSLPVRVDIAPQGDGLVLRGEFSLRQTDLGIEPYIALGGALKVRDALDVHFTLHARP